MNAKERLDAFFAGRPVDKLPNLTIAGSVVTRFTGIDLETYCKKPLAMADAAIRAAHELGLGSVVLGIFDEKKLAELLELPEGMGVACLMPLGYPAEEPAAPKRKEVADLLSVK